MKIMTTNEKRVYVEPQMKVIEIASSVILADSVDPQPEPDPDPDPDVIYPNFRG
ncbi:MAG: hypothetical protein MJZ32_11455 [Bacteroidaceae bacterium]|nr:hypothetical protein [Bacteroidaceae bacterium]